MIRHVRKNLTLIVHESFSLVGQTYLGLDPPQAGFVTPRVGVTYCYCQKKVGTSGVPTYLSVGAALSRALRGESSQYLSFLLFGERYLHVREKDAVAAVVADRERAVSIGCLEGLQILPVCEPVSHVKLK